MEQNSELYKDLDRVLITKDEIAAKVRELGQQITRDYAGKQPVLVCILKGASVFFTDLIREIDLPLTLDFMAISSYGSATKTSGVVRILKDLDNDILGKDVIVVEDIVDTGITLSYLTKTLMQRGRKACGSRRCWTSRRGGRFRTCTWTTCVSTFRMLSWWDTDWTTTRFTGICRISEC